MFAVSGNLGMIVRLDSRQVLFLLNFPNEAPATLFLPLWPVTPYSPSTSSFSTHLKIYLSGSFNNLISRGI